MTERELYANKIPEDDCAPVTAVRQARVDADDLGARFGKFVSTSVRVVAGTRFD